MPDNNNHSNNLGRKALQAGRSARGIARGSKVAYKGTKNTGKAAVKAVKSVAGVGVKIVSFVSPILLPILAIILSAVIIVNVIVGVLSAYSGTSKNDTTMTTECEKILYIFESFTETSNDKERSKYNQKLQEIEKRGYNIQLCAIWKVLVDGYYYNHYLSNSVIYKDDYDKSLYKSAYDNVFNDYVARYYLNKETKKGKTGYTYSTFKDCGRKPNDYINEGNHYYFCNNTLKMCIDSFYDKKANTFIKFNNTEKKQENKKEKKKKKKSTTEKKEKENLYTVIKNLEGKDGLINTCLIQEQIKNSDEPKEKGVKRTTGATGYDATIIKEKKIKTTKKFLSEYIVSGKGTEKDKLKSDFYGLYPKRDGKGKKPYTFSKDVYTAIYNQFLDFQDNGSAFGSEEFCKLAHGELGKHGVDYCHGQVKAWTGGLTEWCAIFQAYLLEHIGLNPVKDVGWNASCSQWISNATKKGIYRPRGKYTPKAGDILFFTWGHVGMIYKVNGKNLVTIEGNTDSYNCSTSRVGKHTSYTTDSYSIRGYLDMSKFFNSMSGSAGQATNAKNLKPKVIDAKYTGHKVALTKRARRRIECLVYGENNANGYVGCLLVAQCLRDHIYDDNKKSLKKGKAYDGDPKHAYGYDASDSRATNTTAKNAVKFIFDKGGYAVKHRIYYFYCPQACHSAWHETQLFIIEHGRAGDTHRYFDAK